MTKKNKSELSPIQQLAREKKRVKSLYLEEEKRLAEDWEYLTNNMGYLVFNSVVKSAKESFMPSVFKPQKEQEENKEGANNILNSLSMSLPLIWEIAQPMLLKYAIKKIKSLFSSKKDKKSETL